jgi:hypothetical protein
LLVKRAQRAQHKAHQLPVRAHGHDPAEPLARGQHLRDVEERGQEEGDGQDQIPLPRRVEAVVGVAGCRGDVALGVGGGGGAGWG